MMQQLFYDKIEDWQAVVARPYKDNSAVQESVRHTMQAVKTSGDTALRQLALQFDGAAPHAFLVQRDAFQAAEAAVPDALKKALQQARQNIETFHRAQQKAVEKIETVPGITCWQKAVPIEKVGLYIPGGTAPLFSTVLMLGVPAQLAGCAEKIMCTPPQKDGLVHPAVLYAAQLCGIEKVYKVGGAQAIAAMAYGTESIPSVYKIFGPGNQYVTAAKQWAQWEGVAIDMPAGPSEVCVLADDSAVPEFVAADLLSQAEHGADSQVLLITTSQQIAEQIQKELAKQLEILPRGTVAAQALQHSKTIICNTMEEAIWVANRYAAEHLILACANAAAIADTIKNAGSVFIGNYAPESAGDYASGTNHTLPTNGFARAYSGVSLDSFYKKITFQQLTHEGLKNIGDAVITMAEAEGLQAHANAVKLRLNEQ